MSAYVNINQLKNKKNINQKMYANLANIDDNIKNALFILDEGDLLTQSITYAGLNTEELHY